MSMFLQKTTCMNDGKILAKTLKTRFAEVEVYDTPQKLVGYQGDKREQQAEIVVRRQHVGTASNDIGFARGTDGNYTAMISSYDSGKYGDKWLQGVTKDYLVTKAKSLMSEQDAEFLESVPTSDGGIRLTFRAPVYA